MARRGADGVDWLAVSDVDMVVFRHAAAAGRTAGSNRPRAMKILYFALAARTSRSRRGKSVSPPDDVVTIRDLISWLPRQ